MICINTAVIVKSHRVHGILRTLTPATKKTCKQQLLPHYELSHGVHLCTRRARCATIKHSRNGDCERSGDFPNRRFSFTPFTFNNFLLKPTVNLADSPSTASRIGLMRWLGLYTLRLSKENCTSFQMNIMPSQQKQKSDLRKSKRKQSTLFNKITR